MNRENLYPEPFLPDVDYQQFDENYEHLSILEYGALENLKDFLEKLEEALLKANMIQIPELIIAHLCCYLGSVTAIYKAIKAKGLKPKILNLIKKHANFAYAKFAQYPVNSSAGDKRKRYAKLDLLRENSPGSIIPQTLRLGRVAMDMMNNLGMNRDTILSSQCQSQAKFHRKGQRKFHSTK